MSDIINDNSIKNNWCGEWVFVEIIDVSHTYWIEWEKSPTQCQRKEWKLALPFSFYFSLAEINWQYLCAECAVRNVFRSFLSIVFHTNRLNSAESAQHCQQLFTKNKTKVSCKRQMFYRFATYVDEISWYLHTFFSSARSRAHTTDCLSAEMARDYVKNQFI